MSMKTVSILVVTAKISGYSACNQVSKFIEELGNLNYDIAKVTVIPEQVNLIRYEIEWNIKYSDLVLVLGQIDVINESVAKVLSQQLAYCTEFDSLLSDLKYAHDKTGAYLPKHARIIANNCYPVVHLQRIFIVNLNHIDECYRGLKPYLQHYRKERIFRKVLDIKPASNDINLLTRNVVNNGVCVECTKEHDIYKVCVSSTSLSKLIDHEQAILKRFEKYTVGYRIEELEMWQDIFSSKETHLRMSLEVIEKCIEDYGLENVFVSFNGGKDCTVLLHLVLIAMRKRYPIGKHRIFCLYVQSENPFPEQDQFIEQCRKYYNLELFTIQTDIKTALIETLAKFPQFKACFMGTRRTDPYAADLQHFQMTDSSWPQLMRASPLLDWHYSDIWDYLLFYKVPYCKLYDMGYTSLGNPLNTTKNQSLAYFNVILQEDAYLPAYKLLKEGDERNGRE